MTSQSSGAGPAGPPVDPVAEVVAAVTALADLDRRPTSSHVATFDHLHTVLTDALSTIDEV